MPMIVMKSPSLRLRCRTSSNGWHMCIVVSQDALAAWSMQRERILNAMRSPRLRRYTPSLHANPEAFADLCRPTMQIEQTGKATIIVFCIIFIGHELSYTDNPWQNNVAER